MMHIDISPETYAQWITLFLTFFGVGVSAIRYFVHATQDNTAIAHDAQKIINRNYEDHVQTSQLLALENSALRRTVGVYRTREDQLKREILRLRGEVKKLESSIHSLEATGDQLSSLIESYRQEIAKHKQKINQLQNELGRVRNET